MEAARSAGDWYVSKRSGAAHCIKPNSKVYGILSVLVQAFYNVEYLFDVPASAFKPAPKL